MIAIIAAIGKNNELGKNGDLCWRIKADLKRFKRLTTGYPVVMGYNTYKSLKFKPLPNRENIVITDRKLPKKISKGIKQIIPKTYIKRKFLFKPVIRNTLQDFIEEMQNTPDLYYIIGGGKMYEQFLPFADRLYLTEIHKTDARADTFFPDLKLYEKEFERVIEEENKDYSYVTYYRRLNEATGYNS